MNWNLSRITRLFLSIGTYTLLISSISSVAQVECPRNLALREHFVSKGLYDSIYVLDSATVDCAQRTWGKDDPRNQQVIHDFLVSVAETKRKEMLRAQLDECIRLAELNPGKTARPALKFLIVKAVNFEVWGGTEHDAESLLKVVEPLIPMHDFEHDDEGVLYLQQIGKLYSRVTREVDSMLAINARAMALAERKIASDERVIFYGDYRRDHAMHARLLEQLATEYYEYQEDYEAVAQLLCMSINQYLFLSPIDSAALMHWHKARPLVKQFLNVPQSDVLFGDSLFITHLENFADSLDVDVIRNDSDKYAECIYTVARLANLYQEFGRYADAESLHRLVLKFREKLFGADSPITAASYNNIANTLLERERFAEAKSLYQEGIRRLSTLNGPTSDIVIRMTGNLADAETELGNIIEAERLLIWYLEQRRGSRNRSLEGLALHKLGEFYLSQGRLDEAEKHLRAAILIKDSITDLQPFTLAESYRSLADVLIQRLRLLEAEPLLRHALALQRKAVGNSHPTLVQSLIALGDLQISQLRVNEAILSYNEAAQVAKEYIGDTSFAYGEIQLKTVRAHLESGNHSRAASLLNGCLEVTQRQIQDSTSFRLFELLLLRAVMYREQGMKGDALADLEQAQHIIEAQYGKQHPSLIPLWLERARTMTGTGEENEHDSCIAAGLYLTQRYLHEQHPVVAEFHEEQARQGWRKGKYSEMIQSANLALRIRIENVRSNASGLVERDAVQFAQQMNKARDLLLTGLRLSNRKSELPEEIATNLFNTKGLILDCDAKRRGELLTSSDTTQIRLARAIQSDQYHIARLMSPGKLEASFSSSVKRQIDSLRQNLASLQSQIAIYREDSREGNHRQVTCADVQSMLSSGDGAIEYFKYNDLGHEGESSFDAYAGLVLKHDSSAELYTVGRSDTLEKLIAESGRHLRSVIRAIGLPNAAAKREYLGTGTPLFKMLFPPDWIRSEMPERIYLSPDAAIFAVSFAGLPVNDSTYLVEQSHVQNCSHLRGLTNKQLQQSPSASLLAIGGPDYENESPLFADAGDKPLSYQVNENQANFVLRSVAKNCGLLTNPVQPLAHASREIEQISKVWQSATNGRFELKSGVHASERYFKEKCGEFSILHVATHGFVLDSSCFSSQSRKEMSTVGLGQLFRSGLCLAGANAQLHQSMNGRTEDGFLTAYEISLLDLHDLTLVVLSACETGRGETEPGQGIYGMRRAFELAGAKTILSSLWEIDDRRTVRQMTLFYQSYLEQGDAAAALRSAQLAELRRIRTNKQADHPALWAAFIVHGNRTGESQLSNQE